MFFFRLALEQVSDSTRAPIPTPTDKPLNQPRVQIANLFHGFKLEAFFFPLQSMLMVNKTTVYTRIRLYLQGPDSLIRLNHLWH